MTRRRPPSRPAIESASADDLLTTLGRLTAQARERAELQHARVELAEALQREMLPAVLPAVPGLRTAAKYAPARVGLDIGGDWYDGFALPDGALAFCVGDVQGHDVEAAATMGQVRIGLRAVAATAGGWGTSGGTAPSVDPGLVLSRANDVLLSVNSSLFATCSFLRYDPATHELESARAGHVASVWATADGRSGVAEDAGGLPLGIQEGEAYPVTRRRLTVPGAFVLLTDGVVEGPSFPLDEGLTRAAGALAAGVRAGEGPEALAARVMRVAELTGNSDDAAVLVLCHDGEA
ncbi:PP2C family protein-serine/threonine phosphatase [Streptomyces paludis]|uniref:Serine/threonine-protein phosphatase n=1 Tax=Streptomyces paludis TaxID=2282738 RepID=A0A345HQX4_9ACTN|nr:PP2C family protein-serine/threonine phosphatase [Streptomyces paludis]AXG79098.1 serine/threonine-protein phosphatase [Streptomyces paludis]